MSVSSKHCTKALDVCPAVNHKLEKILLLPHVQMLSQLASWKLPTSRAQHVNAPCSASVKVNTAPAKLVAIAAASFSCWSLYWNSANYSNHPQSTYGCVLNYRSTGTAPIYHLHNYFNAKDPPVSGNQSWPRHEFGGITAQSEHFLHPWGWISKAICAPGALWLMSGTFFHRKKTQVPRFPHLNTQGKESPVTALYRSGPGKNSEISIGT